MILPIPFKLVAFAVAAVCFVLFVILAAVPQAYAPTYGVVATESVQFMTMRASPMFLLPVVVLLVAATHPRDRLRDAVAVGTAIMWLTIAASGVLHWSAGIATSAILVAAALECVMAAALLLTYKN